MNNYETLILLSPELAEDARTEILDNLGAIIEREGGSVAEFDHWGVKTLAYPVKKQSRGYYVRVLYAGPGPVVAELERNIRINDGIYKFVTVKLDQPAQEA